MTLKNNETFYELPDAVLKVTEKSNLVRIQKNDKAFVAREIIESIIAENDIATYIVNYYDVIDGSKVLSLEIKRSVITNEVLNPEINKNIDIILLSKIFNVTYDSVRSLTLDEVIALTSYQEEKTITKNKNIVF